MTELLGGSELLMSNIACRVATPYSGPKILNLLNMAKTKQMGALLVAIEVLNSSIFLFLKIGKDG